MKNSKYSANYQAKTALLQHVSAILKDLKVQYPAYFNSELRGFCKEVDSINEAIKAYTPPKAAKLSVSMQAYFRYNHIEVNPYVSELVEGFESVLKKGVSFAFSQCAKEITELLYQYKSRTFLDAELFFIDEEAMIKIAELKTYLESKYENRAQIKSHNFNKLINVLDTKLPSHKYSVKYISKHQQINKVDSVRNYLPSHFEVWRSKAIAAHKELLKVHNFDEDMRKKIVTEHQSALRRAKEEYEFILKNMDTLDVRIAGYEHATLYPSITYATAKRSNDRHLRSEVVNALWFKPYVHRLDMSVKEFIESSQSAFGDVYYKEKVEE